MPNVKHLPGISATGVLDQVGREVDRVVSEIEAESRRIGILK
jgi:hypothetical protein